MKKIICIGMCSVMLAAACMLSACADKGSGVLLPEKGNEEQEVVMTDYAAPSIKEGEIFTFSQISGTYNPNYMTPVDMPVAYGMTKAGIANAVRGYKNNGYEHVGMMVPMGRDATNSEFTKTIDDSIIQRRTDGSPVTHPGGCPYVYPSEEFAEWLAEWGIMATEAGAEYIFVEEPDGFVAGAYSEYFKEQWAEFYDEEWRHPDDYLNPIEYNFKRDQLIARIFINAYDTFAKAVKKSYPNVKVILATHTAIDYAGNHKISANNYEILKLDSIDGLVVQAWTDTSLVPVYYEGATVSMPFENSYLQYSEGDNYLRGLEDKIIYTLADAKADGNYGFDVTRPIYQDNIVAQCLMPNIYSYESNIWPDRSFAPADEDYKTVQEGIMQMQRELHNYGVKSYTGTRGVGVVMSYDAVSFSDYMSVSGYLQAMALPLLKQGIPVEILTLESLTDTANLEGINVLILSYDFMKPQNATYNEVIADWVRQGGSLVYVGGEATSEYFNSYGWWGNENFVSPQEHLFNELGLTVTSIKAEDAEALQRGNAAPDYMSDFNLAGNAIVTEYNLDNGNVLYETDDGRPIVVERACGEGAVTLIGLEPNGVSADAQSVAAYRNIIKNAIFSSGSAYSAPGYLRATRGNYEIIRTFEGSVTLDGEYIDLFDNNFKVVENPTIAPNTSALYKKVGQDTLFGHSSSTVTEYEETADGVEFIASNGLNSRMQTILRLPEGSQKASVTVTDVSTGAVLQAVSIDTFETTIRISYKQSQLGSYQIKVKFS